MISWKVPFESIGDPEVTIGEELRTLGLLNVQVDRELAGYLNAPLAQASGQVTGGRHENGVYQPAIIALSHNFNVLYRWASVPSAANIGGAMGRPRARRVWELVQNALAGDLSGVEGDDVADVHAAFLPVFYLALLVNGFFVYPRGFNLTAGYGKLELPICLAVVAGGICAGATALVMQPELRVPLGLGTLVYAAYVRCFLWGTMDTVWKVSTPSRGGKRTHGTSSITVS
jgi:hypothetical protein